MKNQESIITYSFGENFIERLADYIYDKFYSQNSDLSRIACVFGGRRPALFLRRALARRIGQSFVPPVIFSIDDFVKYCLGGDFKPDLLMNLDASFLVYDLAKNKFPDILGTNQSFAEFLPWAQEIVSFIEQLDLEDISFETLRTVRASAVIGYEIPPAINSLLAAVAALRKDYHQALLESNKTTRACMYGLLSKTVEEIRLDEFEKILFCNFFYLHGTESRIIKEFLSRGQSICFFQGASEDWSVLDKTAKSLGVSIKSQGSVETGVDFRLHEGFDIHSQASLVRSILERESIDKNDTVIVLPRPEALLPVLGEVLQVVGECNVSMGYPLRHNAIYVLFELLAKINESAKGSMVYAGDYLALMRHPLVKNCNPLGLEALTRVIVHKIEDFCNGAVESSLAGRIFLSLEDVESEKTLFEEVVRTLSSMGIDIEAESCRSHLICLHRLFVAGWDDIGDFGSFSRRIREIIDYLSARSGFLNFPFNVNALSRILELVDEIEQCSFNEENFKVGQIWDIFKRKLQAEVIAFKGSPLRGTQILGLLETRSLNFETVIIMDMNESILPKLHISEPLIPREVMLSLGINRLEKEEEIQRYQFKRLIKSAKNVHLIYAKNNVNEKSRFIEELLWQQEKARGRIGADEVIKAKFQCALRLKNSVIKKTPAMVDFLRRQTYSASRINTYLSCPLQFYFQYVLGLSEKDDLLEGPQAKHIGTFIHELLEETFSRFLGQRPLIDSSFRDFFFSCMEEMFSRKVASRMRSDAFLLKGIIAERLKKFLDYEKDRPVKRLVCLEDKKRAVLRLKEEKIMFAYTVDRVDELDDDSIIVIDYKTGGSNIAPKSFKRLKDLEYSRSSIKEDIRSFQLPLYYYFTAAEYPHKKINAVLYNIRDCSEKYFIAQEEYSQADSLITRCLEALEFIFEELFDCSVDFEPDPDEQRCRYCSFRAMCGQ